MKQIYNRLWISNYSDFVLLAKKFCLIITLLLALVLILFPLISPSNKQVDLINNKDQINEDIKKDILKIEKPHFFSVSYKYGPYQIIADKINQNMHLSLLTNPRGFFVNNKQFAFDLHARNGIVYANNQKMKLIDNVYANYDDIYQLKVEELFFDIKKFILFSPKYTIIESSESKLNSEKGFESFFDSKTTFFWGPISLKHLIKNENKTATVYSDSLEVNNEIKQAIFKSNVRMYYDETEIYCDNLTFDYLKTKTHKSKVYLYNNIRMITKEETINGNYGVFDIDKRVLTLSKGVTIIKGKNEVKGNNFVYSFKDNKGEVVSDSNSKRVRANIIVKEK